MGQGFSRGWQMLANLEDIALTLLLVSTFFFRLGPYLFMSTFYYIFKF